MKLHKIHSPKNRFSIEDKHRAVQLYLSGQFAKGKVISMFGVSYAGLDKWINKYGPSFLDDSNGSDVVSLTEQMKKVKPENQEELQHRIAELEKRLEMAKLKAELLETMIDIAEEELHIPIRKKFGPQPSKEKHKKVK